MPKLTAVKKARAANKALYAPRAKPPPAPSMPKPIHHLVSDDTLKKIIQRILEELKLPGKIPSVVIFGGLAEVRDLVEQAAIVQKNRETRKS